MDNHISFKAKFIKTSPVKKLSHGIYKKIDASFVELNKNDLKPLYETTSEWNQLFSNAIYNNAQDKLKYCKTRFHLYALTTQKEGFETLQPKKVLGLVEYQEGPRFDEINLLQINPKYKNNERTTKDKLLGIFKKERNQYKNCGKSIIDSLKEMYKTKTINVDSATSSTGFYEKNGFKSIYENGAYYTWSNKKSR